MREYAVRLKKLGISYDRYRELVHFCRQYDQLGEEQQEWIRQAARMVSEEYWETLVESICKGETPYRYMDVPYSESQYKRMRRSFFQFLHEIKK